MPTATRRRWRRRCARDEEFEAVYQVLGEDGRIYWVSTLGARVPVAGTHSPEWEDGHRQP